MGALVKGSSYTDEITVKRFPDRSIMWLGIVLGAKKLVRTLLTGACPSTTSSTLLPYGTVTGVMKPVLSWFGFVLPDGCSAKDPNAKVMYKLRDLSPDYTPAGGDHVKFEFCNK